MRNSLTPAQRREAMLVYERGFIMMPSRTPCGLTRYRPLWKLVDMGLIEFDRGPVGSWLQTSGFMPRWGDPVV